MTSRKLGGSVQQYDITVKRLTQIEAELKTVSVNYNNSVKVVKDYETKFAAVNKQVAELTNLIKITNAKAALEKQVHSLSVKIEEIETNSVATSKRTIQKMEIRITELEEMINVEKKSHAATMTEMQVKTRQIKELVLQSEEDREKIKMYKRQLEEQEGISNANIMRVKKFQRELEC